MQWGRVYLVVGPSACEPVCLWQKNFNLGYYGWSIRDWDFVGCVYTLLQNNLNNNKYNDLVISTFIQKIMLFAFWSSYNLHFVAAMAIKCHKHILCFIQVHIVS